MTFFTDLSPYSYDSSAATGSVLNVGWLDARFGYPQGDVPPEFIERLWAFCRVPTLVTFGFHVCDLCHGSTRTPVKAVRGSESILLGFSEIRVFGADGKVYAAPNLIYHYVTEHGYRPPEEFI